MPRTRRTGASDTVYTFASSCCCLPEAVSRTRAPETGSCTSSSVPETSVRRALERQKWNDIGLTRKGVDSAMFRLEKVNYKKIVLKLHFTFLALISAMSSIISSCRLWELPLLLGGPVIPVVDSRRLCNILVAPPMGNAAMDSRRLRPKRVVGTLEIVTTECRRPPDCGAGACERVARKAASLADGPEPSPPRSLNRRTYLRA